MASDRCYLGILHVDDLPAQTHCVIERLSFSALTVLLKRKMVDGDSHALGKTPCARLHELEHEMYLKRSSSAAFCC